MFTFTGTLQDHGGEPLTGVQLLIQPTPATTVDALGKVVHIGGRTVTTDEWGTFTIDLAASDGLSYTVRSTAGGPLAPVRFAAGVEGTTVNLADATPLPAPSPMATYVRGASSYEVWLDAGNTGTVDDYFEAIRGPAGGASDPAIGAVIDDPGSLTRAALDAHYSRDQVVDANKHGIKADGVTDDSTAWNTLVQSCPPGTVITWTGRSMLHAPIGWKSGVSLIGKGAGRSVLATTSPAGTYTYHAAIRYTGPEGASATNPLVDCTWADFEIDGSELPAEPSTYRISAKGTFTLYHRRCHWRNLYIHDTQATGLGSDFMIDCTITGVVAERCGRMNPGNVGGGAGIGIGTGAWEDETLIISDCITRDNGNWGIFVEWQIGQPHRGRGTVITGCTSYGDRVGIGDRGTVGTTISGNMIFAPKVAGVMVTLDAQNTKVVGNQVYGSAQESIQVDIGSRNVEVRENSIHGGGRHGIRVAAANGVIDGLTIADNHVSTHANAGIVIDGGTGTTKRLRIRGNRIWDNGQAGGSYTQAIRLDGNTEDVEIVGNRAYDTQATRTQSAGLILSSSSAVTAADLLVEGNNFTGSPSTVLLRSATRPNSRVRNNVGFVTENSGTATIADGAASVTVPHGLAAAPTLVQVTKHGAGDVWVSTVGTTNIIITRTGTSGALRVDWAATYKP